MIAWLTRARRCARTDDGLTLVETVVSMVVLGIIMAAVASIFVATTHTVTASQNRVEQGNGARNGIEAMARSLRAAVLPSQDTASGTCAGVGGGGICLSAFIQGTATSLQFYSNIDNPNSTQASGTNNLGPRKVGYSVDAAHELVEVVQQPDTHQFDDFDWQYSDCATVPANCRTRVLATDVTQVGGTPIFTYYESGVKLTGSSFDATQLEQVDAIDVVFSVEKNGGPVGSAPTTYIQRVALPNVDTYISEAGGS